MTFTKARFEGKLLKEKSDFSTNILLIELDSQLELEIILPKSRELKESLLEQTTRILASGKLIVQTNPAAKTGEIAKKVYKLLAKDLWSLQADGLVYLIEAGTPGNNNFSSESKQRTNKNKGKSEEDDLSEILLEESEEEIPF